MKINSIYTLNLDKNHKVISSSKTIYKIKPIVDDELDPFFNEKIIENVNEHLRYNDDTVRHIVTISTTKGKYIKTFKSGDYVRQ